MSESRKGVKKWEESGGCDVYIVYLVKCGCMKKIDHPSSVVMAEMAVLLNLSIDLIFTLKLCSYECSELSITLSLFEADCSSL